MAAITSAVVGVVSAGVGITQSLIGARNARNARDEQNRIAETQKEQMELLEAQRPAFKDPSRNLKNAFANMTNPYANLTVATQAFELQAEEADKALANSLDVMMETGMGAGGATALAQAALQSKRGIAASIQSQEAQNLKLKAEGEMTVQKSIAQGEEALNQLRYSGDAAKQQDAIDVNEAKQMRAMSLHDNALQSAADFEASRQAGVMNAIGGVTSLLKAGVGLAGGIGDARLAKEAAAKAAASQTE